MGERCFEVTKIQIVEGEEVGLVKKGIQRMLTIPPMISELA